MDSSHAEHRATESRLRGDIAIIGMACMFPGAPDLDAYWQNIVSKVDAITDPPPESWDANVFYDPNSADNDRVYCKRGGFLGPIAYFDALQHGVMPKAIDGSEPDQWLALQVAHAALVDAGYSDETPSRHRTTVVLGKGSYLSRGNLTNFQHGSIVEQTLEILRTLHPDYTTADLQWIKQELKRSLPPFNSDTVPGLTPNITAGRIANRLDLMGPSYTVDAACASSLIAIDRAMRDLLTHEYDLALAGGIHIVQPAPFFQFFCQLGALSHREQIRPFDKDADGTILGEGVGIVVLKRREDAERDGDRIYAVIKGVGSSSDGRGLSVTAPRLEGEVLALRRAYAMAGIAPQTIGLIEAHGTATPVGDATEIEALSHVFGPRQGEQPSCAIGSIKSMIGHLMPASGIAGVIKTALALYHKVLPPTLNVDEPNPKLELERTPFYINTEVRPWIHGDTATPRRAGVNAFGFGGINAHVIMEEHNSPDDTSFQSHYLHWDSEVCILEAESRQELIQHVQQLARSLQANPQVHLKDLAYTLNVALTNQPYRVAIVATSVSDLQQKLNRVLERLVDPKCRQIKDIGGIYFFEEALTASGRLAFVFPGEGSQYVNMLADLCIHFPEVRKRFDAIDSLFTERTEQMMPIDFTFPRPTFSEEERQKVEQGLWQMEGAVAVVLAADHALASVLNRLKIHPDALVGHSTGEFPAMLAAGMLDIADEASIGQFVRELHQIYQQAAILEETPSAALVAVSAGTEIISAIIDQVGGDLHIGMDNCPHQTVIVGEAGAIDQVIQQLRSRGIIYERLHFDRPYHTSLFSAFSAPLRALLHRWLVTPPQTQLYSCTTTTPFSTDLTQIEDIAVDHWMRRVEFRKTIETMYADGIRIFVEVGPRGNLTAFIDDILRGKPHLAVQSNVTHRSGVAQLNHMVGMLAAQGVPMKLDYLYAHRSPQKLILDQSGAQEGHSRHSGRMKLVTAWPQMRLSPEAAAHLPSKAQTVREPARSDASSQAHTLPTATPLITSPTPHRMNGEPQGAISTPTHPVASSTTNVTTNSSSNAGRLAVEAPPVSNRAAVEPAPVSTSPTSTNTNGVMNGSTLAVPTQPHQTQQPPVGANQVMSAYFQTMEQFLAVQQDVMQGFLAGQSGVRGQGSGVREVLALSPEPPPLEAGPQVDLPDQSEPPSLTPAQSVLPPAFDAETPRRNGEVQEPVSREQALSNPEPSTLNPQAVSVTKSDDQPIPATSPSLDAEAIGQMLLQLVSERTGYPVEMLDRNLDLEADLGIDSIKRVEILGSLQRQTDLLHAEDMEALASRKTLQEVIDFLIAQQQSGFNDQESRSPAGETSSPEASTVNTQPVPPHPPLLDKIVSLIPGEELVALRTLHLDEDLFLRHHTFGRDVSVTDPNLTGLPVMPLTMSMEMMAEASALLVPGQHMIGARGVRANRWIVLEQDQITLRIVARRRATINPEVELQIHVTNTADGTIESTAAPIIEGTIILGTSYPKPPIAGAFNLPEEEPWRWSADRLYEDIMFHGPAFRGVASMDGLNKDGARATLRVLPPEGLLRANPDPAFNTDPVVLDQMFQVLGFWAFQRLETDHAYFPFRLEALHLYSPPLAPGETLTCRAHTTAGDGVVRADMDIVREDGSIWARGEGWEERRFEMPLPVVHFMLSPRNAVLSSAWSLGEGLDPELTGMYVHRLDTTSVFPKGFFNAQGAIWLRALAYAILSQRERNLWFGLRLPAPRRTEWLMGRVVAKDAVRQYLYQRYNLSLCPADIEILPDEHGQPIIQGSWTHQVPSVPKLTIAHIADIAVAVITDDDVVRGIGVDIEHMDRMNTDVERMAFTPSEQTLLATFPQGDHNDWALRCWCAKEAVAKALGQGMHGNPQSLVVQSLDTSNGMIRVQPSGELARQLGNAQALPLTAFTVREDDLIIAITSYRFEMETTQNE